MSDGEKNADVRSVLELAVKACTAYERLDLNERVKKMLDQIGDNDVQVVVVGEFKQGKSSLINALVNANVCPVDDDIATAVPTIIGYGEERQAWAVHKSEDPAEGIDGIGENRQEIAFEDLARYATENRQNLEGSRPDAVEVALPRKFLAEGLVLVDTPGVGGLGSAHATAAIGALSVADAVLFVSDASQEFTRAEMDFLNHAVSLCPTVYCVMTKTDFYPQWREVLEINKRHLVNEGHGIEIIPTSSTLRVEAIRRNDKEINNDSGFPVLLQKLTGEVVGGVAALNRRRASADVQGVCDQLAAQFETELTALKDPDAQAKLVTELEAAKDKATRLRSDVGRWQTTLNDGVTDLMSDVDHDFRARMRQVSQEGDEAIDNSDPMNTWNEFEMWLVNRMSHEVIQNYRFLRERATELSGIVAEHFDLDGSGLFADLDIASPSQIMAKVEVDDEVELDDLSKGKRSMTILRGSYSGMLMFTVLGGMVAAAAPLMPLAAPGVGLLMGRGALKDEKERQLMKRRAQAKNSMRRYNDEINFQVSKDSRDTLRRVQRQLRDHYQKRAEELNRSTNESLKAAQDAARTGVAESQQRVKVIEAELGRIDGLRKRAAALVGDQS